LPLTTPLPSWSWCLLPQNRRLARTGLFDDFGFYDNRYERISFISFLTIVLAMTESDEIGGNDAIHSELICNHPICGRLTHGLIIRNQSNHSSAPNQKYKSKSKIKNPNLESNGSMFLEFSITMNITICQDVNSMLRYSCGNDTTQHIII
jgi:hypothetical protein